MRQSTSKVYRVDKFKVPPSARDEFIERLNETHEFLRTLPGFLWDSLLEQSGGPGDFNFVTIVQWESAEALGRAKEAVTTRQAEIGFAPSDMFVRLDIEADLANYAEIAPHDFRETR